MNRRALTIGELRTGPVGARLASRRPRRRSALRPWGRFTAGLLVLTAVGWFIALFHVLVVAGVIPERVQPCVQGVPCSETYISLLGFLNIPMLSVLTFTLVGVLLFYAHRIKA